VTGCNHYLYFNEDATLMLERLPFQRIYLYQRRYLPDTECQWAEPTPLRSFPSDLLKHTQYPFVMSPDFSKYIDLNRKTKEFLVRDSKTGKVVRGLDYIEVAKNEGYEEAAHRIKWLSNDKIGYITQDGLLVDGSEEVKIVAHY
jgi:hypothetical protein